jgi:uncharacterized membrane protein
LIRKHIFPKRAPSGNSFNLRGQEIQRIETFSDAVFAFAVTLLIVSLEVPRTFEELLISMRGFFAFGICFTLLMLVWYEQHIFFRRYGLDDLITIILNGALLFIVLFYVYPLKFLWTLVFSSQIYGPGKAPVSIRSDEQVLQLMMIYGFGYMVIQCVFLLLYFHALRKKAVLDLNHHEVFDTKTKIWSQAILVVIGIGSILFAWALPIRWAGLSGLFYILIGPAFWLFYYKRRKMRLALDSTHAPHSI